MKNKDKDMFWVRSLIGQRCMAFGYNNYFYISNIPIYAMYFMAVSINYDAYKGFIVFFFSSVNAMSAPIRGRGGVINIINCQHM